MGRATLLDLRQRVGAHHVGQFVAFGCGWSILVRAALLRWWGRLPVLRLLLHLAVRHTVAVGSAVGCALAAGLVAVIVVFGGNAHDGGEVVAAGVGERGPHALRIILDRNDRIDGAGPLARRVQEPRVQDDAALRQFGCLHDRQTVLAQGLACSVHHCCEAGVLGPKVRVSPVELGRFHLALRLCQRLRQLADCLTLHVHDFLRLVQKWVHHCRCATGSVGSLPGAVRCGRRCVHRCTLVRTREERLLRPLRASRRPPR